MTHRKFFPVIHCLPPNQSQGIGHALCNTRAAMDNGADGVFLIGHGVRFQELTLIYEVVRKQFPEIWIGINFLDIPCDTCGREPRKLTTAANRCQGLNALWVDGMPTERLAVPKTTQVFGGVAFKYIAPRLKGDTLANACRQAPRYVDVATTSGDQTGSAPSIAKLKSIKRGLDDKIPLALASGITSQNVLGFLSLVDMFLVATSICERKPERGDADYLIPEKVREMALLIHG